MRILRAAGLVPQPWKNGLGVTRPIHEEAHWLIGVADLGGEAAFSRFENQDRAFTLIQGEGATMELEGQPPLPCIPFVPALFPGDVATRYRPAGGPARAFNVIFARGRVSARVQVASVAQGHALPGGATAVFCASGRLSVLGDAIGAGDTVLHPGAQAIGAERPTVAILVWLAGPDGSERLPP